jgi:hypothetical protein
MKKYRLLFIVALSVIALLLVSISCSTNQTDLTSVDEEGNTSVDKGALDTTISEIPVTSLTSYEQEGILYMREEEKLARDVYLQLYDTWGTNNFNNIGSSEQTHMDAMKSLIDRYGLSDPAEGLGIGEFTNPELQQLHDDLIEQGSKSEIDALKVGAAIEEIDILDIERYVQQTSKLDIEIVYENLLKGSRNHLRSFVSVMEKRGLTYEPQYISTEQYKEITTSDIERGGR